MTMRPGFTTVNPTHQWLWPLSQAEGKPRAVPFDSGPLYAELRGLTRPDLVARAKEAGINAGGKSEELISKIVVKATPVITQLSSPEPSSEEIIAELSQLYRMMSEKSTMVVVQTHSIRIWEDKHGKFLYILFRLAQSQYNKFVRFDDRFKKLKPLNSYDVMPIREVAQVDEPVAKIEPGQLVEAASGEKTIHFEEYIATATEKVEK